MRKESKILLEKATDSLILSIEHFNRPWDKGRPESVLILLDRAFELFLKSAILHKGGKIRKKLENQTIGFDTCVRTAITMKIINEEQTLTLQSINHLRDAAQHHFLSITEQMLYLQAMAGLTLYRDILKDTFKMDLNKTLPKRVLPVCTTPPQDIATIFESEVEEIRRLLMPKRRKRIEANSRLRPLVIFDSAIRGESVQPSNTQLSEIAAKINSEKNWKTIFSGAASISITSDPNGPALSLRITKNEGIPIHLVPEGTPGAAVVAAKRVNELDFYNLSPTNLAKNIGLSLPKTLAMIRYLKLNDDQGYFKQINIGKAKFNRYSQEALKKLKEELPKTKIDEIWNQYGPKRKAKK